METLQLPQFSYSQVGVWNRCHFSWFLNYHEKWAPIETKSYFVEGSVGHDLFMIYYKNIALASHRDCISLVKTRVGEYLRAAGSDPDKLKIVSTIARVVKGYLEDFAPAEDRKWDILDAEKEFLIPLKSPKGRTFNLEGKIDILARDKSTGRIYVWDHKFIGRGRFYSQSQLVMDNQTPTYIAALQLMGIPVFGAIMNQLNKHDYKEPATEEQLYRRASIYHTESELKMRLYELGQLVDELEDCKETGIYRRSLGRDCADCFFQDPCVLLMKAPEITVDQAMGTDFIKKQAKRALI